MVDYEKMYKILFNGTTDALLCMEQLNFGVAKVTLVETQQKAEEIFMGADSEEELAI